MPAVVADTGPIHYLVLIGHSGILPVLFGNVIVPFEVFAELARAEAPEAVRRWIRSPPAWLDVHASLAVRVDDSSLEVLDNGERAALLLRCDACSRSGTHGRSPRGESCPRKRVPGVRYRQEIMDELLVDEQPK